MYQQNQKDRCEILAEYLIERECTVRAVARVFAVSKSTVHKDVTDRLNHINPALAAQARVVLDINKAERHIRAEGRLQKEYVPEFFQYSEHRQ